MASGVVSAFQKVATSLALARGREFILGSADERALHAAFSSAIAETAREALPSEASAEDVGRVSDVLESLVSAEDLAMAEPDQALSVTDAFAAVVRQQLGGLYSEDTPGGVSYAAMHGFRLDLDHLVQQFIDRSAVAVPFHATRDAVLALEFRAEHVVRHPPASPDRPRVDVRYLMCRDLDAIADVIERRLDRLPFRADLLFENEISDFWDRLAQAHGSQYRDTYIELRAFGSVGEYESEHSRARTLENDVELPGWRTIRVAEDDDVVRIAAADPLTKRLRDDGVPAEHLAVLTTTEGGCGGDSTLPLKEWASLRPVWALLMHATIGSRVTLESLSGHRWDGGVEHFDTRRSAAISRSSLPAASLDEGTSVLIPLATLIPRISFEYGWRALVATGLSERERTNEIYATGSDNSMDTWGPGLLPTEIVTSTGVLDVRAFDPALFYTIDRSWTMGSCPHVFSLDAAGTPTYLGTAFDRASRVEQSEHLIMPGDAAWLLIAEIEDEVTFVGRVTIDGVCQLRRRWLGRGDAIRLAVRPSQRVELIGYYVSDPLGAGRIDPFLRTRLVRDYLTTISRNESSSGSQQPAMGI